MRLQVAFNFFLLFHHPLGRVSMVMVQKILLTCLVLMAMKIYLSKSLATMVLYSGSVVTVFVYCFKDFRNLVLSNI